MRFWGALLAGLYATAALGQPAQPVVNSITLGGTGLTPATPYWGNVTIGGTLLPSHGGTGAGTLPLHNVLLGGGTGPITGVAPSTSGNVLTSNGTTWVSATPATSGTVTSVSVVSMNGFAGTVATATTTPAITLSTTINSPLLAGNGTAILAANVTGTGSTAVLSAAPTLTGLTTLESARVTSSGDTAARIDTSGGAVGDWQFQVFASDGRLSLVDNSNSGAEVMFTEKGSFEINFGAGTVNIGSDTTNGNIEIGSTSVTPFIDFHSGASYIDFDVRLIAGGGDGMNGHGNLSIQAADIQLAGIPKFSGTNSTGGGSALLGTNSPASTLTAPYTWITVTTSDGTTGYMPVWK
jgi:hypothetical protein